MYINKEVLDLSDRIPTLKKDLNKYLSHKIHYRDRINSIYYNNLIKNLDCVTKKYAQLNAKNKALTLLSIKSRGIRSKKA